MSSIEPQPNTTHTYAHTYAQDTHIRNHTPANTYICTENKNTICSTENTTQNTAQNTNTEQYTQNKHNLNTLVRTVIHIYSFDFIAYDNISKNSIIQLYTKLIHFARLIDEVSK